LKKEERWTHVFLLIYSLSLKKISPDSGLDRRRSVQNDVIQNRESQHWKKKYKNKLIKLLHSSVLSVILEMLEDISSSSNLKGGVEDLLYEVCCAYNKNFFLGHIFKEKKA
jgi:hypothetical protein